MVTSLRSVLEICNSCGTTILPVNRDDSSHSRRMAGHVAADGTSREERMAGYVAADGTSREGRMEHPVRGGWDIP